MTAIEHEGSIYQCRRATQDDVRALRALLNLAYKELADRGWNYSATYQDDVATSQQITDRRVYLFEHEGQLRATVTVHDENWFTAKRSLYVGRFGVHPSLKRTGFGSKVMQAIEQLALRDGYEAIQLDTAKPAEHLVSWYQRLGYKIVGETHYEGKTYDSWIFEKLIK